MTNSETMIVTAAGVEQITMQQTAPEAARQPEGMAAVEHLERYPDVQRELTQAQLDAREERRLELERTFSYDDYKVARKEMHSTHRDPSVLIRGNSVTFNQAVIDSFEDVSYINGKYWGHYNLRERINVQSIAQFMDWDDPDALSFVGEYVEEQKLLLFGLENSAITCAVVPDRPEEGDKDDSDNADVTPQKVVLYSHETGATLDIPITTMAEVSLLERKHYAGDWDVLRPATKLEEKEPLTQDRLAELMSEAEEIIERWAKNHDEQ